MYFLNLPSIPTRRNKNAPCVSQAPSAVSVYSTQSVVLNKRIMCQATEMNNYMSLGQCVHYARYHTWVVQCQRGEKGLDHCTALSGINRSIGYQEASCSWRTVCFRCRTSLLTQLESGEAETHSTPSVPFFNLRDAPGNFVAVIIWMYVCVLANSTDATPTPALFYLQVTGAYGETNRVREHNMFQLTFLISAHFIRYI